MKKLIWTLVILVVVGVFGGRALYLHKQSVAEKDTVKIGAILPLTGLVSTVAEEVQNALNLAIEELNAKNSIKLKLFIEDGKYTEKDSINALHKIMTKNISGLIVSGQLPAMGVGPFIKQYNLPVIVTIAGGDKIPLFNEYIFRFYTPARATGTKIATFAKSNLNVNTAGIFHIKNDMGRDSAIHFEQTFQNAGGRITNLDTFDLGAMNVRSQVAKMLDGNPEAIYIVGFGPGYCAIMNALKESGYRGYILTGGEILQSEYKNNIKDLSDIYFVDTIFDDLSKQDFVLAFNQKYYDKFHKHPGNFAAFNYEAMLILGDALQQTKMPVLDYLKTQIIQKPTLFGPISFDQNGEITIPLVIKKMKSDGTYDILEERE